MTLTAKTSRGFFGLNCGALAGVVSAAILAFSLAHADSVLVLCAYVATVPLFMAGFGAGILSCLIGALVGTIGLFFVTPPGFGAFYLFSDALPAIGLMCLAMRRKTNANGDIIWANEGDVASALAIYPCLMFIGVYLATLGHEGGLLALTNDAFDSMTGQVTSMLEQSGEKITPDVAAMIHSYMELFARIAPSLAMCAWLFSTMIAMIVAQSIIQQQKWNLRPVFMLTNLRMPVWLVIVAVITGLIGAVAPAPYNYVGMNLAIVLGVPFFLVGLAVIHALAAQTRSPTLILIVFYVVISIPICTLAGMSAVVLVGAVDQWADFRKRFAARPSLS